MKLNFVTADPAGNITVFVLDDVPKAQYVSVANRFLSDPRFGAEQVGFVKSPILGGENRLEMMGGEFCGNAARSFGLLCARGREKAVIEITGSAKPLQVMLSNGGAWVDMPLPTAFRDMNGIPAVEFEGITHLIVQNRAPDEAVLKQLLQEVEACFHPDAVGVLFVDGPRMIPAVHVKGTDSTVWERSCGSGTFAYACWQALAVGEGSHTFSVSQPGGTIAAEVVVKNGTILSGRIGGPVSLSDRQSIEM